MKNEKLEETVRFLGEEIIRLQEIERKYNNLLVNSKQLSENNIILQEKLDECKFKLAL